MNIAHCYVRLLPSLHAHMNLTSLATPVLNGLETTREAAWLISTLGPRGSTFLDSTNVRTEIQRLEILHGINFRSGSLISRCEPGGCSYSHVQALPNGLTVHLLRENGRNDPYARILVPGRNPPRCS